jgi:hypothetical protein
MERIFEIQKKSNQWLTEFTANVVRILEASKTVEFNKDQMLNSRDADDKPLIHKSTGSDKLTKAYAKRTGKSKPNLFVTGEFQDAMFMIVPSEKEYFISSKDFKAGFLSKNYGKIMGISPKNQPKAQEINNAAIVNDYLKTVFQ